MSNARSAGERVGNTSKRDGRALFPLFLPPDFQRELDEARGLKLRRTGMPMPAPSALEGGWCILEECFQSNQSCNEKVYLVFFFIYKTIVLIF